MYPFLLNLKQEAIDRLHCRLKCRAFHAAPVPPPLRYLAAALTFAGAETTACSPIPAVPTMPLSAWQVRRRALSRPYIHSYTQTHRLSYLSLSLSFHLFMSFELRGIETKKFQFPSEQFLLRINDTQGWTKRSNDRTVASSITWEEKEREREKGLEFPMEREKQK